MSGIDWVWLAALTVSITVTLWAIGMTIYGIWCLVEFIITKGDE